MLGLRVCQLGMRRYSRFTRMSIPLTNVMFNINAIQTSACTLASQDTISCLRSLAEQLPLNGLSMHELYKIIKNQYPLLASQISDEESLINVLRQESSLFTVERSNDSSTCRIRPAMVEEHLEYTKQNVEPEENVNDEINRQRSVVDEMPLCKEKGIAHEDGAQMSNSRENNPSINEINTNKEKCNSRNNDSCCNSMEQIGKIEMINKMKTCDLHANILDALASKTKEILEENHLPLQINAAKGTIPFISLTSLLTRSKFSFDKDKVIECLKNLLTEENDNVQLYATIQLRPKQERYRNACIFVDGDYLCGADLEQMSAQMRINRERSSWYIFRPHVRAPLSNHDFTTHDVLPTYLTVERAVRQLYEHEPNVLKDVIFMCADVQSAMYMTYISKRYIFHDADMFVCTPGMVQLIHKREVIPLNGEPAVTTKT